MNELYVYVIGPKDGLQKIGRSVSPKKRLKTLQSGSPLKLHVHFTLQHARAGAVEIAAHRVLHADRVHGEWFRVSPGVAIAAVHTAVECIAQAVTAKAARQVEEEAWAAEQAALKATEIARVEAETAPWRALMAEGARLHREQPEAWQAMCDQWQPRPDRTKKEIWANARKGTTDA